MSDWRPMVLLVALILAGCGEGGGGGAAGGPEGPVPGRGLVVVASDYLSTSVSIVEPDEGEVVWDGIIHSGSTEPGLSTALSGDVVSASSAHPDGLVTLIDRYPNGVVSLVRPQDGRVVGQLSVATGFAANPQDVTYLDPTGLAYVSRFGHGPADSGLAAGDDLLLVRLGVEERGVLDRIDLRPLASEVDGERVPPRPARMASAEGLVWVVLACLGQDFSTGGPGVLVGLDPSTHRVVARVELPGTRNCMGLVAGPGGLWVACSGIVAQPEEQLGWSALVQVPLSGGGEPGDPVVYRARDYADRPIGFELGVAPWGEVAMITFGSLPDGPPDRLGFVNPQDGAVTGWFEAGGAFSLGGMVGWGEKLWVCHGVPSAPELVVFTREGGADPVARLDPSPSVGLPPRSLGTYGTFEEP